MSVTTVSELMRLRRKNEREEYMAYILGIEFTPDVDEDRYRMDCDAEYAKCSQENPCKEEDWESDSLSWDLHLGHIQDHCEYNTCPNCYVIDLGELDDCN